MTDPNTNPDAYAGASQSAAEVAGRAIGTPAADMANAQRAESDGYFYDGEGVRRKIRAGDPIPAGVELEGTKAAEAPSEDKAKRAGEDKAKRAPAESK